MITHYNYIHFVRIDQGKGKTQVWECRGSKSIERTILGEVRWYGAWRQYCFWPAYMTLFNNGCLRDIQDFIKQLMDERKVTP